MPKPALTPALAGSVLACLLAAGSAHAQNVHSWVSSTGTGSACTRAAPCATLNTAIAATVDNGVISILDAGAGDTTGATISKPLTVRAVGIDGGHNSSPLAGAWLIVNPPGPNDVVNLEGLHLTGGGIRFDRGAQLNIIRCVILTDNLSGEAGIRFQPTNAAKLSITETVIANFGLGTGGGIVINPQPGGSARVALERVTVNGNAFGVAADGTGSTAGINMTIADSMIANNAQDGIIAVTPGGGAPIGVLVKNTKSVNNAFGIRSLGTNVTMRVSGSSVTGNGTGLSFGSGGELLTFGNNEVQANGTNGAFSGTVGLQ